MEKTIMKRNACDLITETEKNKGKWVDTGHILI